MCLECRLAGQTENGNLVADIVNITVDEKHLDEKGQPDLTKMGLITFNPAARDYLLICESVGSAWVAGKKLM